MADFPGSLHTFIDPATKSGQPLSNQHIAAHAEVAGELAAVEATLGVNPQGGFSTVAAHIGSKTSAVQAAAAAPVQSVAGRTGAVTLSQADVSGTVASNDARLSDARPPTIHTHIIGDVTGLQAALDSKGTSNLALGTTGTTAKAGNWVPAWTEVTGKPSTFAPTIGSTASTAVAGNDPRLTDARTPTTHTHIIADVTGLQGALDSKGTSNLTLGTTSSTAKAGDWVPAWSDVTGKPATCPPTIGSTSTTAVAGNDPRLTDARTPTTHTHTALQISDASTAGRAILTAADAAAQRTAMGAGTSSLALGTTSSTAKAGDYVPTWTEVSGKPTTFAPTIGSTASTAVAGNDVRLSDARTPTAHSHIVNDVTGLQAALDAKAAATGAYDVTTANVSGSYSIPLGPACNLAMTANTTFSLPPVSQGATILVQLSGAFTPTWPAAVTTPATYTSGGVYALTTLNGGTSWFMERVA